MLARPDPARRQTIRPSKSLLSEYNDFIQQRIEDYKNQMSREELLGLADQAVGEIDPGSGGQLALTEMLVLEQVDRLIITKLNLPRFARWRNRYPRLRLAQRQATHWNIEPESPITELVLCLERRDTVLVAGRGCAHYSYYVAAHDSPVLFLADDVAAVDQAERRAGTEALSSRFEALAVNFAGPWFPEVEPALVVIDYRVVLDLPGDDREAWVTTLKRSTRIGGSHYIPLYDMDAANSELEVALLARLYEDWDGGDVDRGPDGILATKPA